MHHFICILSWICGQRNSFWRLDELINLKQQIEIMVFYSISHLPYLRFSFGTSALIWSYDLVKFIIRSQNTERIAHFDVIFCLVEWSVWVKGFSFFVCYVQYLFFIYIYTYKTRLNITKNSTRQNTKWNRLKCVCRNKIINLQKFVCLKCIWKFNLVSGKFSLRYFQYRWEEERLELKQLLGKV